MNLRSRTLRAIATVAVLLTAIGATAAAIVGTTGDDFYQPGTQTGDLNPNLLFEVGACTFCHAGFDADQEPYERWQGSMHGQAMRDPVFHAAFAIAKQDVDGVGEFCIRCHSPKGWTEGRKDTTGASALAGSDYDGISCHFCHRLVDPVFDATENPAEDAGILAALTNAPGADAHSGQYVLDTEDRRRGPFDLGASFAYHEWRQSPFHRESALCGTCHDINNPVYSRNGGAIPAATDTYDLNSLAMPAPTNDKSEGFPLERTFTEWSLSDFAVAPIDMGGRFGGNITEVSTCQDCHMPDTNGTACQPFLGGAVRNDLPLHNFNGSNSWVALSVFNLDNSFALYGPTEASGEPLSIFQNAVDRNIEMLELASDMELSISSGNVNVRIINQTGHKLPTGYTEGRRMWLNVKFYDTSNVLMSEIGTYDVITATLSHAGTKIYEAELGPDAALAAATGLPVGPSFHATLSNKIYKDNRIPPRGFNNAAFEAGQAQPVAYSYADGQYWDDTLFPIPPGAAHAEVTLFHQTTTKEYIEFLKNENTTDGTGTIAYDQWVALGKSAPVEMDTAILDLLPRMSGDLQGISVSAGGTQVLDLNAGIQYAGAGYIIAGTLSGTSPGFSAFGLAIPLNYDFYTQMTIIAPGSPLVNSIGVFDAMGQATAAVTVPPGSTSAAGLTLHHAFGVLVPGSGIVAVSNPVQVDCLP